MSQEDDSNLFELTNDFILGNYQSAIHHADEVTPSSDRQKTLVRCYSYRAMVAQGNYLSVQDEIDESSPAALRAVKLLAAVLSGDDENAPATAKALLKEADEETGDMVRLLCASVHFNIGDRESALRCVRGSKDLECLALGVQIYLAMNRPDLAEKELKTMQTIDDDHSCTQLATAWLFVAAGGEKYQDACIIFQELAEKFAPSAFLLNSQAVCHIHMDKMEQAEADLLDALQKDNKNADTLANMLLVAQHRGKSDDMLKRYMTQLRQVAPKHSFVRAYDQANASFEENKDRYAL